MQFRIPRRTLEAALKHVTPYAERGGNLPVLQNVRITAQKGGTIELAATNMEALATVTAEGEVREVGVCTLPAEELSKIVGLLPEATVNISVPSRGKALIQCEANEYKLATIPADDFPQFLADTPVGAPITLTGKTLADCLKSVVWALPAKDHRRVLLGVNVRADADRITFTATDGKQLARVTMAAQQAQPISGTLPRCVADSIVKAGLGESLVEVHLTERQFHFADPKAGTRLVANLIEGKYPDCNAVIPKREEQRLVLKLRREVLMLAARRAGVTTDDKNKAVIIATKAGSPDLSLRSAAHDLGTFNATAQMEEEASADCELAFNFAFLLEVLQVIPTSQIQVRVKTAGAPVTFHGEGRDNLLALLMPIKLADLKPATTEGGEEEE